MLWLCRLSKRPLHYILRHFGAVYQLPVAAHSRHPEPVLFTLLQSGEFKFHTAVGHGSPFCLFIDGKKFFL